MCGECLYVHMCVSESFALWSITCKSFNKRGWRVGVGCGGWGGGIRAALALNRDAECEKVLEASCSWYESPRTSPPLRSSLTLQTLVHHCWHHRRSSPSRCHGQHKQENVHVRICMLCVKEDNKTLLLSRWRKPNVENHDAKKDNILKKIMHNRKSTADFLCFYASELNKLSLALQRARDLLMKS